MPSLLQNIAIFSARFILEVLGSGGAVWGSSEAIGIRTKDDEDQFRVCAKAVAVVFFLRWIKQIMLLLYPDNDYLCLKQQKTCISDRMLLSSITFLLEVCGAAGAIWGFSMVLNWHTVGVNDFLWRPIALSVGLLFLLRWSWQLLVGDHTKDLHLCVTFVAKFVLEVLGSGGAIWGFSDVLGLRNTDEEDDLFRQRALWIAAIFLVRFICQMKDAIFMDNDDEEALDELKLKEEDESRVNDSYGSIESPRAEELTPIIVH
mmetsp:Transcript_4260/g.6640  ORF Transcript_4260/g.6640 Transcript_4260/m.6640 type:complete len:260 (-) Transcript_4260:373-1152(-)